MRSVDPKRRTGTEAKPVIAAIDPVITDPNLRRIKVGRKTMATLRLVDVERLKLKVGQILNDKLEGLLMEAAALQEARVEARRMLARRMLSAGETRDRLARKQHEAPIIEVIIRELVADGWIDEAAYRRAVIDAATRTRPAGSKLLKQKLRSRKIDSGEIVEGISKGDTSADVEAAFGFATRQWTKLAELPRPKAVRRLAGLLTRRGFEEETVADVLQRMGIE
jgi:regulatory protein